MSVENPHGPAALDKQCRKCNKKGLIERACNSNTNVSVKRRSLEDQDGGYPSKYRKIAAVTESGVNDDPNPDSKPVSNTFPPETL